MSTSGSGICPTSLRARRTTGYRAAVMRIRTVTIAASTVAVAALLWWRLRADDGQPTVEPAHEPAAVAWLATWTPDPLVATAARAGGYMWAAPLSCAGLLLGALSGVTPVAREGVLLFRGVRGLPGRMLRWRGFAAATLGHVILAIDEPSPRLLRHELLHVRQAERLGPLFVPVYLAGLLRYGYRNNPLERAAYATARD